MALSATALQEIRDVLVTIAKESGQIILSAHPNTTDTTTKKNTTDIATATDLAVETHIRGRLKTQYPHYAFIGEESFTPGSPIPSTPTFIVDPIDGTTNFVLHFPDVCVSIGLTVDGTPTVGVVYNPFLDELYTGISGQGAHLTRANRAPQKLPLHSGPLVGLRSACVGLDWGSDREGPNFLLNLRVFETLARSAATGGKFVPALRFTGSAAMTICRIAAGQQDMFWECGCYAWDVAAAWCILSEAGGLVVDAHPGNWNPRVDNERFLVVRPAVQGQREIVEEFWGVVGEERSTYGPS
ncbi:uncharacterized protein K452DRAFT_260128 [Aplosporella prunicola CBS 121167]|uniref:Inositol-1-monophosphatase n=1 Tax=Aplosporella prunicola CBS 121167 TaxID=1176127 RepID=A0A6A6AXU8_9PEZI|nr:uncharacterized protein K452DRAFT_260128 [Aplosporella prunicola CBS 121167]KAF2135794.1 hypothetical protein K452DRAFT_260128 [Aplosporella prunicola CBS 121167]